MGELRESRAFGKFKSLIRGQSSASLFSSGQSSCFHPTADLSQGPTLGACASFSQDGFQREGLWEDSKTDYGLASPPFIIPKEPFCACEVKVSLTPRMRNMSPLNLVPRQDLAPRWPGHNCYLKVSTGDKVQLSTLL